MKCHSMTSVSTMLLFMLVGTSPLLANSYYVSPSGSNSTGNGAIGNPWRTVTFAMDSVYPGDVLSLRAGVYNEQIITVRSGTANAYITITAYNDEEAFIDGIGGMWNNGIIIDHSYLKLKGLTVRTWLHTGIWLRDCHFVELGSLKITDVNGGISLTGTVHDFAVDSCIIYDYYGGAGGSGFDATPYGTDSIYNGWIGNSKAYLTAGAFDNCDGFALGHEGIGNIHFSNCEVYGVGDGFDISGTDIVLERCSAHHCTYGGGYKLWKNSVTLTNCVGYSNSTNVELDFDFPTNTGVKARLMNCTLFGPGNANIAIENSAGGSTLQLYNCILAGGDNTGLYFDGDSIRCYTGDYNLFHMNTPVRMIATSQYDFSLTQIQSGDWTTSSGQDAHTKIVYDAGLLFRDTLGTGPDLHLKEGSLAINNGIRFPDSPVLDFDNCPRTAGQIDIGAYEFGACGTSGISEEYSGRVDTYRLDQNYPNPFNPTTTITYQLQRTSHITIDIVDVLGREVATVADGEQTAGTHAVTFDASTLSSGVYFCRMSAGDILSVKKMVVAK
jgi:hypothetical protein